MSTSQKLTGHFLALFTVIVWGSCYVLTKEMLSVFTASQVVPIRMVLAYVTLWILRPKTLKVSWREELQFLLVGLTGGSVYFFVQNQALNYSYAATVSIIVSLSPIFTLLLAHLFSRTGERLGRMVWVGSAVAIVGVVLVVLNGSLNLHLRPLGDLLALGAAILWSVYTLLVKSLSEKYDSFLVTRRTMLWSFLTAVPIMLLTDGMPELAPLFTHTNVLLSWIFLSVLGNAVCFAVWNVAIKRLGMVVTSNYMYLSPFVTLLVGWLVLQEGITWMGLAGAVLITLGLGLADRK